MKKQHTFDRLTAWNFGTAEKRATMRARWARRAERWKNSGVGTVFRLAAKTFGSGGASIACWDVHVMRMRQKRNQIPQMIPRAVTAFDPLQGYRCCAEAKQVFCVCRVKMSCPKHGDRCHGSHD